MSIRTLILNHIISYKLADDPVTGGLHILWLADEDSYGYVIQKASEIAETGMLFLRVISVYNIITFLNLSQQIFELGRMGLHIIIHGDQKLAGCIIKTGHHGIVLTGILRKGDGLHKGIISGERLQFLEGGTVIW